MPGLRAIRRLWAGFFLALFLLLAALNDFRFLDGWEVDLLLKLDPLTALAALLTSGTVYKGLALALAIIVPTLFLGRFFCSWVCPLGILNQLLSHLANRRRPVDDYKINRYRPLFRVKYYLLAGLLVMAAFGALQIGLLDPIALLTRSLITALWPGLEWLGLGLVPHPPVFQGGVLIALLLLTILLANRFMTRAWCRVLCPLGALLGVMAARAPLRIRRDVDRCTGCGKCLRFCQGGCDPDGELRVSECHVCMNCLEQCPEGALHYGLPNAKSSAHQPLDLSRRRLVESGLVAAALLPMTRGSLAAITTPSPQVIRPPGSLPEREFLARCIKCSACMKVCPTHVLQPALLEGGLEGLWTPVLINRVGYCEHHCVLCGHVCPTGAIRPLALAEKLGEKPFDRPLRLGTAFFDWGRCLPWSMDTPCIVCEEVCPTTPKAIWYETVTIKGRDGKPIPLKRPRVEPSRCIGCGICENKCPVRDQAAIRVTSVGESRSKENRMVLKGG